MATTKRERQKAARRAKLEQQRRDAARRRNVRRSIIVSVIAVVVILSGSLLFTGSSSTSTTIAGSTTSNPNASTSSTSTTTTAPGTTTTLAALAWSPVTSPQAAGTWGTAPSVVVPTSATPTVPERTDLIVGHGTTVNYNDNFTAQYVLADYASHKVLQSSWSSGPFSSTLNTNNLIPGWVSGIQGMKVGGRRELVLPPSLGYGAAGQGSSIPGNDTLIFIVDLISVTPYGTATTTTAAG